MSLPADLRKLLDEYVDSYFLRKTLQLAKAFGKTPDQVRQVLTSQSSPILVRKGQHPSVPPQTCQHDVTGLNPRKCGKAARFIFEATPFCSTHFKKREKSQKKKNSPRKIPQPAPKENQKKKNSRRTMPQSAPKENVARALWDKKPLEKKFNFVVEDGRYIDTRTRICFSPSSKEAYGYLSKKGPDCQLLPLTEEQSELLAACNLKQREDVTATEEESSGSEDGTEELVLEHYDSSADEPGGNRKTT